MLSNPSSEIPQSIKDPLTENSLRMPGISVKINGVSGTGHFKHVTKLVEKGK
jgi:hypothetical protein